MTMTSAHCKSKWYILRSDIDCHLGTEETMKGEINNDNDNNNGGEDGRALLQCPGMI